MSFSRQLLLGTLALGLQVGLARAADPGLDVVKIPPASPLVAGPTLVATAPQVPCAPAPCCNCCDVPSGGLIGGAGLYLIQPYFDNNMAFGLQGTAGRSSGAIPPGSPGVRTDTRVDISHHMDVAPLVWLGYMGENGLGARARWWYFRQGSDQSVTEPTGQGGNGVLVFSAAPLGLSLINAQTMIATSKLEVQVGDLEALDDIRTDNWDLLLAGGVRLASISQTYNAFVPQSFMNAVLSTNYFQGIGPTLALEARRALGTTGLSLYASGRGSLVYGSAHQVATVPDQQETAQDHRDLGMAIGEAELGIEFGRNFGGSWLFGQVALVGQEWFGAGSASRSSVNVLPGGGFVGAAYTGDSDLAFLGLSIRLGLNY